MEAGPGLIISEILAGVASFRLHAFLSVGPLKRMETPCPLLAFGLESVAIASVLQ